MAEKFLKIKITSRGGLISAKGSNTNIDKRLERALSSKSLLLKDLKEIAELTANRISVNVEQSKRYDNKGGLARNSEATIKRKGFDKPLIETGRLVAGVKVVREGNAYIVKMSDAKYSKSVTTSIAGKKLPKRTKRYSIAEVAFWNNKTRPFFGITKKEFLKYVTEVTASRVFRAKSSTGSRSKKKVITR